MAGPIYKMFYSRMKEPWFQLSPTDQQTLFTKVNAAMKSVGGTSTLLCDSSWASEKWVTWGVEEFPSLEAVQEYARCLVELEWFRYCEAETLLGTPMQPSTS